MTTQISSAQYRATLESRKAQLIAAIETSDKYTRAALVKELRNTINEEAELDEARMFIQELETKPNIQVNLSAKVLRT